MNTGDCTGDNSNEKYSKLNSLSPEIRTLSFLSPAVKKAVSVVFEEKLENPPVELKTIAGVIKTSSISKYNFPPDSFAA